MNIGTEICPDVLQGHVSDHISKYVFVYMHLTYMFFLPYSEGTLNIWMCWNFRLFLFPLIMTFAFLQILLSKESCSSLFSSRLFPPCYGVGRRVSGACLCAVILAAQGTITGWGKWRLTGSPASCLLWIYGNGTCCRPYPRSASNLAPWNQKGSRF